MKWVKTAGAEWINLAKAFQVRVIKEEAKETYAIEIMMLDSDKFYRIIWEDSFANEQDARSSLESKMQWSING